MGGGAAPRKNWCCLCFSHYTLLPGPEFPLLEASVIAVAMLLTRAHGRRQGHSWHCTFCGFGRRCSDTCPPDRRAVSLPPHPPCSICAPPRPRLPEALIFSLFPQLCLFENVIELASYSLSSFLMFLFFSLGNVHLRYLHVFSWPDGSFLTSAE